MSDSLLQVRQSGDRWRVGLVGADLAPDIQQAILDFEPSTDNVPRFREREVCTIAILPNWEQQRVLWKRLVNRNS